jgi:hypothetical protein
MSPNAWGKGELRGLSQKYCTAVHRSPINFGDLTPNLTYAVSIWSAVGWNWKWIHCILGFSPISLSFHWKAKMQKYLWKRKWNFPHIHEKELPNIRVKAHMFNHVEEAVSHDFATDPFWIPLYIRKKFAFLFISVTPTRCRKELIWPSHHWANYCIS